MWARIAAAPLFEKYLVCVIPICGPPYSPRPMRERENYPRRSGRPTLLLVGLLLSLGCCSCFLWRACLGRMCSDREGPVSSSSVQSKWPARPRALRGYLLQIRSWHSYSSGVGIKGAGDSASLSSVRHVEGTLYSVLEIVMRLDRLHFLRILTPLEGRGDQMGE